MRKEYDFSKGRRNPYAKQLKKAVSLRLDDTALDYFKGLSKTTNIPYQTLINLYLLDCARHRRKLDTTWR